MPNLFLCFLFLCVDSHSERTELPSVTKFGFAQSKKNLIVYSYFKGTKGMASLTDLSSMKTIQIDNLKANFMFPMPLLYKNQFVLLDPLLKKTYFLNDAAALQKTVNLKDTTPTLGSLRISTASVYDDSHWLLTIKDLTRNVFIISLFSPETGSLQVWFETKANDEQNSWSWVKGQLLRANSISGELALIDPKSGKRLKLLQAGRDPLIPKQKMEWMEKLKPLSRMGQVVFGSKPFVVSYEYPDDDPLKINITALTFVDQIVVETPLAVLGEYKNRRLLFDWNASELIMAGSGRCPHRCPQC